MSDENAPKQVRKCAICRSETDRPLWGKVTIPFRCHECMRLGVPEAIRHSQLIRCPKCLENWDADGEIECGIFGEGEHTVKCPECGWLFSVITDTHPHGNFISPAIEEWRRDG